MRLCWPASRKQWLHIAHTKLGRHISTTRIWKPSIRWATCLGEWARQARDLKVLSPTVRRRAEITSPPCALFSILNQDCTLESVSSTLQTFNDSQPLLNICSRTESSTSFCHFTPEVYMITVQLQHTCSHGLTSHCSVQCFLQRSGLTKITRLGLSSKTQYVLCPCRDVGCLPKLLKQDLPCCILNKYTTVLKVKGESQQRTVSQPLIPCKVMHKQTWNKNKGSLKQGN